MLVDRIRTENLPAHLKDGLQRELSRVVKKARQLPDFPHNDECSVLLAICGDRQGLDETRKLALITSDGKRQDLRNEIEEMRIRAIDALLNVEPTDTTRRLVEKILGEPSASSSTAFRARLLDALENRDDPGLAPIVLRAYRNLAVELKPHAVELLTERSAWTRALLAAVEAKQIPTTALNVNQLRRLQKSKDPAIVARVKAIYGTIREQRSPQRERIVAEMKKLIRSTPGDPVAGQSIFGKLCGQCHKIYGVGQEVGPDITANGRNDFDQLLSNVFDPSLVIGPGYHATTIATNDGRVLTGLLAEEGKERIILKVQGGKVESIPRNQIEELKTSVLSLMPEEVEKQFSTQELADLFAFLCLDKPPSDPAATAVPGSGPIRRR